MKTNEQWLIDARRVHGTKYEYKDIYKGAVTKIDIICPKHGVFSQTPSSHLCGSGCRKCSTEINSNKLRKTTDDIIKEFKEVHGDRFDYSKTIYINDATDIIYDCPKHGERKQPPHQHLRGKGCSRCSGRIEHHQDFLDDIAEVHGDKYIYLEEYTNSSTNLKVQCKACGTIFRPKPGDHLSGTGCPTCAMSGFNPTLPAILYYFKDERNNLYKLGITNYDVTRRFHSKIKYIKIIKNWSFDIGQNAKDLEKMLHEIYSNYRCDNDNFRDTNGGYTEFFSKDVLNLDK